MIVILSAGVAVLTLFFSFKMFFADGEDCAQCVKYHFIPELWSRFRGRLFDDWEAEWRFNLWLFLGIGAGLLTLFGLGSLAAS